MAANDDGIELITSEESGKQNGNSSELQCYKVPELPPNKDFHFFVCYSQDSSEQVRIIVHNLERLGIKCRYHERDFVAGEGVLGNIHKAIEESVALLVVVSQDFANSRFCSHEVEQALHAKIIQGYTVIPIMVEPCDMPELLKFITYIDARSMGVDEMHLKIYDAFVKNEWSKELNSENNGLMLSFPLSQYYFRPMRFSLARYRLYISEEERHKAWNSGIEITDEDFTRIEHILSDSVIVKYKHIFSWTKLIITFLFILLACTIFIVTSAVDLFILGRDMRKDLWDNSSNLLLGLLFIVALCWPIALLADFCCGRYSKGRKGCLYEVKERSSKLLAETLWHKLNRTSLTTRKFLAIYWLDKLHLLKLDARPCKEYFIRRCSHNELLLKYRFEEESLKAYATRIFGMFTRCGSYKFLLKSPVYPRHPMANGAKCMCQLVEEFVLDDNAEEAGAVNLIPSVVSA